MLEVKYNHFGPWLRRRLRERNLSFSRLAAGVGVQKIAVLRWVCGQRLPSTLGAVESIAEALEVEPATVWDVIESERAPGVIRRTTPPTPLAVSRAPTTAPEDRPFARWLRAELTARHLTSNLLAGQLGVGVLTARAWTDGRRTPASFQLPRLAEVLGVPVETIKDVLSQ